MAKKVKKPRSKIVKQSTKTKVKKITTRKKLTPASAAKKIADERAKKARAAGKPKKKKATKAKAPKEARMRKPAKAYSYKLSALNPRKPRQLPETKLSKKGMTLRKLIRSTPRLMINNAVDVVLDKYSRTKTRSGMPAIKAIAVSTDRFRPNKVNRPHDVFLIGADKLPDGSADTGKPVNKHKKVLASCNCENYVFTWEYANAVHGASRIVYGNGDAPVVTNPDFAPGLCKHLVAVARVTMQKGA